MKNKTGILVNGSLRSAGVTFYTKQGQTIVRSSVTMQPLRRTAKQFVWRQRLAHNRALWRELRRTVAPLITYRQFCALAAKLPPVCLTRNDHAAGAALLLGGIPVSCGTLPDIGCRLASVDGTPALLTDLSPDALSAADRLLLVALRQRTLGGVPRLMVDAEDIALADTRLVDNRIALVGEHYGDTACDWALVRRRAGRCSSQRVVTLSTAYQAYLTPDALQRAADSYGGLTPPP